MEKENKFTFREANNEDKKDYSVIPLDSIENSPTSAIIRTLKEIKDKNKTYLINDNHFDNNLSIGIQPKIFLNMLLEILNKENLPINKFMLGIAYVGPREFEREFKVYVFEKSSYE